MRAQFVTFAPATRPVARATSGVPIAFGVLVEVWLMLKIVLALVLFAHGIGHVMGPLQVFNVATVNPQWHGDSWLLSGLGSSAAQIVGLLLWSIAMIGFIVLAAVVMGWLPLDWWAPLAVVSSVASLGGLALFPSAFPVFSTIGALLVDVAVLVAVLWFHWSPAELPA
jgi:hypothetical protein